MMSGIFDNSGAGEAVFPVSPVQPQIMMKKESEDQDQFSTLNATDLFALLEGNNLPLVESEVPHSPHGEDLLIGDGGSQFLEGFTNLSDYLFADAQTPVEMYPSTVVPLPAVPETVSAETTVMEAESTGSVTVVKSRKRTAKEAHLLLDTTPSTSTNTDHDGYVAKKPRRAVAAAAAMKATTSAGKTETVEVRRDKKYRERRDKNNEASKRSREIRKQKFSAKELKAIELEEANQVLELRVEELERLAKCMKEILVERLSKTK